MVGLDQIFVLIWMAQKIMRWPEIRSMQQKNNSKDSFQLNVEKAVHTIQV